MAVSDVPASNDAAASKSVIQSRSMLRSNPMASEREILQPWDREGEFEVQAIIMGQSKGEITVRLTGTEKLSYLTICGFLPGRVNGQLWRLDCVRESGRIELLDGELIKGE